VITRGKQTVRPAFTYPKVQADGSLGSWVQLQAELAVDTRNVLEQIRDSQMLQCDVRADIRAMREALEKIARAVTRKKRRRRKAPNGAQA
jgi:hypothetical protein